MTHMLTRLWDTLTGYERVTLTETERMLVLTRGRFTAILGPGEHRIKRENTLREVHNIDRLRFTSTYDRALFRTRPELAEAHLTEVRTGPEEVAVVLREGVPVDLLRPEARVVLWTEAGPFTVERHDLTETLVVPTALMRRLTAAGLTRLTTEMVVPDGHVGMLFLDGVLTERIAPGAHAFWTVGRNVALRNVDLRLRTHEVTGHEVLTKDRVTIRVNLSATFRVVDAERAVTAVKDFDEARHRALSLAFRRRVGAMTLDRLLAEKGEVEDLPEVRAAMAEIGIKLHEVALKDVVLPGEMREILNRVVAAEKEAEANVIRRREETNATRSLLNTAKVMAENPVMLRLKELEALEAIAGKVESLTVHNGTAGLMEDIVRLRD